MKGEGWGRLGQCAPEMPGGGDHVCLLPSPGEGRSKLSNHGPQAFPGRKGEPLSSGVDDKHVNQEWRTAFLEFDDRHVAERRSLKARQPLGIFGGGKDQVLVCVDPPAGAPLWSWGEYLAEGLCRGPL